MVSDAPKVFTVSEHLDTLEKGRKWFSAYGCLGGTQAAVGGVFGRTSMCEVLSAVCKVWDVRKYVSKPPKLLPSRNGIRFISKQSKRLKRKQIFLHLPLFQFKHFLLQQRLVAFCSL